MLEVYCKGSSCLRELMNWYRNVGQIRDSKIYRRRRNALFYFSFLVIFLYNMRNYQFRLQAYNQHMFEGQLFYCWVIEKSKSGFEIVKIVWKWKVIFYLTIIIDQNIWRSCNLKYIFGVCLYTCESVNYPSWGKFDSNCWIQIVESKLSRVVFSFILF